MTITENEYLFSESLYKKTFQHGIRNPTSMDKKALSLKKSKRTKATL